MGGLADRRDFLTVMAMALASLGFSRNDYLSFEIDAKGSAATRSDISKLERELLAQVPSLINFFGVNNIGLPENSSVKVLIVDDAISYSWFDKETKRPSLRFSTQRIKNDTAPYAHELSHLLLWTKSVGLGALFAEGLGVYAQNTVGRNIAFPNFGRDLNDVALMESERCYGSKDLPSILKVSELLNSDEIKNPSERCMAYCVAGSFVGYLFDIEFQSNKDLFMNAYYRAKNPFVFEQITDLNFEKLESNWRSNIKK